ncbi:MAG: 30S ribosomal protein S9 [bacterium]
MAEEIYRGTGRRKTSVARVKIVPGSGNIFINRKTIADYFKGYENLERLLKKPLVLTESATKYDTFASVSGGGMTGQATAVRHGISRALIKLDDKFISPLRKAGCLTRDSRMVERKKPGQKKARKRFQFSKR